MKPSRLFFGMALLLGTMALPTSAQVSNDNEDGVYKTDSRMRSDFVPGQVIVKFKDASTIQVRRNAKGKFMAASLNPVDKLLREYGVADMEKLFPKEVAKPAAKLRKKVAPNGTTVKERNLDKIFLVKTSVQRPDSIFQLIDKLKEMDDVEYAEPNYYAYITADVPYPSGSMPSQQKTVRRAPVNVETEASVICANPGQNPLFSEQYAIAQQNIQALWDKPIINKKRPVIAILDTGVDITHPDLVDNIWTNTREEEGETAYDDDNNGIVDDVHGWNFVDNYYELTDRNSHGTHVAGIAAAADNGLGIVGANPLALIMPVKVMDDRGQGDDATIARGILYAAENGADVINMSFGSSLLSGVVKDALDNAYQTAVLVASAGNEMKEIYNPDGGTMYPAAYYLVLGVQAPDFYSNYDPDGPIYSEDGVDGRNYEVKVPGTRILSTVPGGNYKELTGTSMSAPLFAGAVSALQMVKNYPSRDVLYGDLIHLNADFAKIFSDDTPREAKIDLVSLNIDDNMEGNSNIDGQVDVGETIKFTPVLRNTWADATDIQLSLSVDDAYSNFVEIVNPEVSFGWSLSAYGRAEAKTPIQVRFADNIGNNTRVKFALTINCPESNQAVTNDVYVTVNNMVKLSGIITEDRTLTADHEYLVSGNMAIPEGVTLTIEPGTVIRFKGNTGISNAGNVIADGTPEKPIIMTADDPLASYWNGITNATLRYCKLSYVQLANAPSTNYENCELFNCGDNSGVFFNSSCSFRFVNISECGARTNYVSRYSNLNYSNVINNRDAFLDNIEFIPKVASTCNWINTYHVNMYVLPRPGYFYFGKGSQYVETVTLSSFPYFGTSREDILRPHISEMGTANSFVWYDLTNMRKEPIAEAHGIVWKVVVNGKDAQDEYEDLAPLGVGKHKFEVYFNRPMNKAVAPQISFGVREPYTQNVVDEDGSWNEEGTVYTAYKTITGRTMSDGVNRIYVYGAEDNEFFEIPYEKTRFNINIQAVGSMATGFAAEAGLGKVDLTWNNENNDFEDAMGFNVYRYSYVEKDVLDRWGNPTGEKQSVPDTIRINQEMLDIAATEFTDYEVTPGETYYYYYKVLSTDLKEYDVSNVVAATPLTSTKGDANGSGDVDVADVITTVNYAAGQEPKPFIFEAADMNTDLSIDILDVIGIIKVIMNPDEGAQTSALATATYTVEDGVVYVDCPVALAGVQVQLATEDGQTVTVADDLKGFETTSAWLTDNDYLFLGYSMSGKTLAPGKHALLNIGTGQIAKIRLSDMYGRNVEAIGSETTDIDRMGKDVMTVKGVYNMSGQKVAGSAERKNLPKGVYIINGEKVVR